MTWSVEILSLRGDLEAVSDVLSNAGYKLCEVEEQSISHLLCHPKYEEFDDSNAVWEDAKSVVEILRRFSELDRSIQLGLDLGSIRRVRPDGTFNRHHFAEATLSIVLSISAHATVAQNPEISDEERERRIWEEKAAESARRRDAAIRRASSAIVQPIVLQVMELLQIPNPSGTELGHIVDLVRNACDGDLTRFASKTDLKRFDRSINHPEVLGMQARHAVPSVKAPPKPMTITDATAFARRVGSAWLEELEGDA